MTKTINDERHCNEEDREFFQRELASFIPDKVFDAHAHLYHADQYPRKCPPGFPASATFDNYTRLVDCLYPGRRIGGLFLPKPILRDVERDALPASEWIAANVADRPYCVGAFLVRPDDDPEWVREHAKRLGLRAFKCYHVFSKREPTFEADIPDYLPQRLVKVAGEEGWAITLHMVKRNAVADPENIHWIRHYCTTYPKLKLILAHSARGFQPSHNYEGLPQLADLENVFFDASANCEPMAHESILRIFGHQRLMAGTDFGLASHGRGRSVAVADTFLWLYGDSPVWREKHATIKPVLIALEALRSLKWACQAARLTDRQVEDVFWNNAVRVFGL